MTKRQAKWASSHDWYISTHKLNDGTWGVKVNEYESCTVVRFSDIDKLYAWAGY